MNVRRLWFLLTLSLLAVILLGRAAQPGANLAHAQSSEEVDVGAGVWREGKAVFSDVPILDPLNPYQKGYKPKQPIPFSHRRHVEIAKMECQYCHSGVAKSPYATIPSLDLCMGCHANVLPESPFIKQLAEYYEKGIPVEWEPVNNLQEYAVFNHERHVKAGVGCHKCHGQVNKMDEVEKVSSLRMGWCVSCHRMNGASIDCSICHY